MNAKISLAEMLAKTRWAAALSEEQLARVQRETTERFVKAGSYVCQQGDPPAYWIGVIDGLLKMSSVTPEGKCITFTGMLTGGWFGEGSILKNESRRYDVVALRDTRIAMVPRATFEGLLHSSIGFNHYLLDHLNARLGVFVSLVEYDRVLEADARVARCIAALFDPQLHPEGDPTLTISQEELGYLCSTSRQRTNQALGVLEKAGLIKAEYGVITVIDLERLRNF